MPCDTVQVTTVEFGKNTRVRALATALEALGMIDVKVPLSGEWVIANGGSVKYEDGKLTIYPTRVPFTLDALAREYTKVVVLEDAEKFGWAVQDAEQKAPAMAGFTREW